GVGGAAVQARRLWGVWLVGGIAVVNLVVGGINVMQGVRTVPIVIGLLVNGGVVALADRILRLGRQQRWSLAAHPEVQQLAAGGDLGALTQILQQGTKDEKRTTLRALAALGPAAAPVVPALVEILRQAEPPQPWETNLCELCRLELTLWNRSMGQQR